MSRTNVAASFAAIALAAALALTPSAGRAQLNPPPSTARSAPGAVQERTDVPACQTSGGGTRTRANCEPETVTLRTEMELKLSIEVPALPNAQCEATATTEYHQRNTLARVSSTLKITECAAASGDFTVALRLKDDRGASSTLEFEETWQRSDDQDVRLMADYPIGDNVELVGARIRGLRCTCAEVQEVPSASE